MVAALNLAETIWTEDYVEDQPQPSSPGSLLHLDVPFWLCLEAIIKNLDETCQCRMYSKKLLMMGIEDARNM
jgi:hypothetical protein